MNSESQELKLKIGLVGESGVGKSCCLVRWVDDDFFEADDKYTIGVDYKIKSVKLSDGRSAKLQIYDTAGQERFRTVTASFYRGAHGILLVFDVTDLSSFEKAADWLREIRNYTPEGTPVVLVGNKNDLVHKRVVENSTAKEWALKEGITYHDASAKNGSNINESFMALTEQIVIVKFQIQTAESIIVTNTATKKRKSGRCCKS